MNCNAIKKEIINKEIIHYYDGFNMISSNHRKLELKKGHQKKDIMMPSVFMDILGFSRIMRRFLRLDKCNIFPLDDNFSSLLIIRQKKVYILDSLSGKFNFKFRLRNCRNILHNSICRTPSGKIIFGEYGANEESGTVPIYTSDDNGETWNEIHLFETGEIKHIHNVSYDEYSRCIWVMTGDYNGQCKILKCNDNMELIEIYGDGSQTWRTCGIFFEEHYVYWLMDSPNEISSVVRMQRDNGLITKLKDLDGPVWYIKKLSDGIAIAGVSVEPGETVNACSAQLLYSSDYTEWKKAIEFPKDKWSMKFFKFGVISFSDGNQASDNFCISGEALEGFDGKSMRVGIKR